ncbi:MAG: hydrolase [Planctomycetaceae bacterium]|nr:hydrolase [Planctomycetaceae bacterium]
MNNPVSLTRSPALMDRQDTGLLVVDVQEKLIDLIHGHQTLVWNISRLLRGARQLQIPVFATEQYPQGLGATVPELAQHLGGTPAKLAFSCVGCPELFESLRAAEVFKILVVGIEAHVCIQQTVLDLLANGFQVYVAVDAVSSRRQVDQQVALQRMESAGAVVTTTEAALFEWCQVAGTPEFKGISRLVREADPGAC